ncbi:hypothetical protein AAH994_12845 [Weeksellaceae bacterium A-14]
MKGITKRKVMLFLGIFCFSIFKDSKKNKNFSLLLVIKVTGMPTLKSPIITLCKIANAIVRSPKKYPNAQMPTLIFFGYRKPYFFLPTHSPRFFATLPTTHFSGAGIKRHKFLVLPMLAADANIVVTLHYTSLDLHPPQQRTASVLRSAYPCFFPPLPIIVCLFIPATFLPHCQPTKASFRFPLNFSDEVFY